ncbi:MAG TPA: Ig-like domain-containing protein, partial [Ignavibacteriaceae bacterium]|nr:Ig-like domain-containing protein [Ignavibacteriaceae bacterium]
EDYDFVFCRNVLIYFDDAITNNDVKQFIQFSDTLKNSLSFSYSFPDNAILKIKPDKDLKPDTDYLIKLNLVGFNDAAGNKTDSIFTLKFSTITGIEFTGLSGKINTDKKDVRIVLQSIKDEKVVYTAVPDNTSVYNFERIEPGIYTLWAYSDRDSSGTYSYGYPEPFKYSEEFKVITDTLNLRPRWSVNDYNIEF